MDNKKFLVDLNSDELEAVFDNCDAIRAQVYDQAEEDAYYFIQNEIISYFEHHDGQRIKNSADIETDAYNRVFIKIKSAADFVEDCTEVSDYLSDENKTLLGRLRDKSALYTECEIAYIMSDARQERFEAWFRAGLETITDALKNIIEDEISGASDADYLKSIFVDEAYCKDDLYIIGEDFSTVYEDKTIIYK